MELKPEYIKIYEKACIDWRKPMNLTQDVILNAVKQCQALADRPANTVTEGSANLIARLQKYANDEVRDLPTENMDCLFDDVIAALTAQAHPQPAEPTNKDSLSVAKDAEYATTWKWVLQSIEKNPDHAVLITTTPQGLSFLHGNPVPELESEIERLEHALSAACAAADRALREQKK